MRQYEDLCTVPSTLGVDGTCKSWLMRSRKKTFFVSSSVLTTRTMLELPLFSRTESSVIVGSDVVSFDNMILTPRAVP
jgi:hypothetical protein